MRTKSTFFKTTAILSTALFSLLGGCLVEDQVDYTTDYGSSSTTANQSDTGSTTADTGSTTTDTGGSTSSGGGGPQAPAYIWSQDLGVYASNIAVDSDNNTYVSGTTSGDLNGISGLGQNDYFLVKLDSDGNKLWTKLIGTSDPEIGGGDLVIDNESNVYLSGHSRGVIGTDSCTGPFTGGANANNFLIKFNGDGDQIWYKNLCTLNAVSRYESFLKVDPNTNDIILSGSHMSSLGNFDSLGLNYGSDDIYIIRFSQIGTKLSSNLLGGSGHDNLYDMEIDEYGAIYLTGMTGSNLSGINPGGPSSGVWYQDGFLMKLSSSGSLIWTQQDTIFNSNYSNKIKYTNDGKIVQLRYAYDGTQSNKYLRTFDLDGSILNEIEVSNSIRNIYYNDFIYLSNGEKYDTTLSINSTKTLQANGEFVINDEDLVYGINGTSIIKSAY